MLVRDARDDDMAQVQAIYAHHVLHGTASFEEEPPPLAEMQRRRADVLARGLPYLVAEIDGRVAGYSYATPYRARSAYRFTHRELGLCRSRAASRRHRARIADRADRALRAGRLAADDRGDRRQRARGLDRPACGARLPHGRDARRRSGSSSAAGSNSVLMQRALGKGAETR